MSDDSERAKEIVGGFLANAKQQWTREAEVALWKIARLGFFSRWKAKRIAQEALGIGPFWNKGLAITKERSDGQSD